MSYGQCDWCQESGCLVPVRNRDVTTSRLVDFICAACVEIERFEHGHEIAWGNPIGFMPVRSRPDRMTVLMDERLAS